MVCATWIVLVIGLLVAGVKPEEVNASQASIEASPEDGRAKRQNFVPTTFGRTTNFRPSQQFTNFRNSRPTSSQSQFRPSQFLGSRTLSRGQPAFQPQTSQRQAPQQTGSTSSLRRPSSFQNSQRVLNNDPLGIFRGNVQPQFNRNNAIQTSPTRLSGVQQIIDFQRQQQRETLANIRGLSNNNNQRFRFPQQSTNSQTAQQSFRPSNQFRPSVQISQGLVQSNRVQPGQFQQIFQRPQSNSNANQQQQSQQQQLFQRQQQQALLRQSQLNQIRQQQLRQQQSQQQQSRQQQLQQQQLRQQQLQQQQLRQQQLQQQQLRQQQQQQQQLQQQQLQQQQIRQQQLQQQQLRQQQLQRQQLQQQALQQRQPTQPTSVPRFQTATPTTRQQVRTSNFVRPAAVTQANRQFARPTQTATQQGPSSVNQASFGVPLQSIPSRPPRPANVVRPSSTSFVGSQPRQQISSQQQPNFGVPLSQTTQQRPVTQTSRQPGRQSNSIRPATVTQIPGIPLRFNQRRPNRPTTISRPTNIVRPNQQSFRQQRPNVGVPLSITRPQRPVSQVQSQNIQGAGGLVSTVSQLFPQRGASGANIGGFRIIDDSREDSRDDRTDELFDSREQIFNTGIRAGVSNVGRTGPFTQNLGGRPRFQVIQDLTREDITDEIDSREIFGLNSFSQNRGGTRPFTQNLGGRPRFQVIQDLTREDITDEIDSREIFGLNSFSQNTGRTRPFTQNVGGRPRFQFIQDLTREDITDEIDSREIFGLNSFSQHRGRTSVLRGQRNLASGDFTDEVDSREFLGNRNILRIGGAQPNFGRRITRFTDEDHTLEDLTDEDDDPLDIFD